MWNSSAGPSNRCDPRQTDEELNRLRRGLENDGVSFIAGDALPPIQGPGEPKRLRAHLNKTRRDGYHGDYPGPGQSNVVIYCVYSAR
jgi:hypothetical protein